MFVKTGSGQQAAQKIQVFDPLTAEFVPQPEPVAVQCVCGQLMVRDHQGSVFCPECKRLGGCR